MLWGRAGVHLSVHGSGILDFLVHILRAVPLLICYQNGTGDCWLWGAGCAQWIFAPDPGMSNHGTFQPFCRSQSENWLTPAPSPVHLISTNTLFPVSTPISQACSTGSIWTWGGWSLFGLGGLISLFLWWEPPEVQTCQGQQHCSANCHSAFQAAAGAKGLRGISCTCSAYGGRIVAEMLTNNFGIQRKDYWLKLRLPDSVSTEGQLIELLSLWQHWSLQFFSG